MKFFVLWRIIEMFTNSDMSALYGVKFDIEI